MAAEPDFSDVPVAPDLRGLAQDGLKLERRLDRGDTVDGDFMSDAADVLRRAVEAGSTTWLYRDRDELALVMARAFRVFEHGGKLPPEDLRQLEPFDGRPPTFRTMEQDEALEGLGDGKPAIGRRLVGVDLRQLGKRDDLQIMDCVLIDCDLRGLELAGARFVHSALLACKFEGAVMPGATLSSCAISGIVPEEDAPRRGGGGFDGVQAPGANFSASRLDQLTLSGCDLSEAIFTYAHLVRTTADASTSFAGATFDMAAIEEFDGDGADFRGAMFIGTSLLDVQLNQAKFDGARFSSARFGGAHFLGAEFSAETSLESAYFGGVAEFDEGVLVAQLDAEDEAFLQEQIARRGKADIGEDPANGTNGHG